jgi:hypothetical protein
MDRKCILDRHRKTDILPTFFGTVGEVINGIEDPVSSAAEPAKSMAPSMAVEVLRAGSIAYSSGGHFSAAASIGCNVEMIVLQEAEGNRECAVTISRGNMFAKKINIGDNFSGFGEYINKFMDFTYALKERGIKSMPAEGVVRLEHIFPRLINTKGFLKGC